MKLEKREVALNEKDSILDMLFFEESLQERYRRAADAAETKEEKSVLGNAAGELTEIITKLKFLLQLPPKM